MKTVLIMLRSNAPEWAATLGRLLPDYEVTTGPADAVSPVSFAVVGKPPPGAIAALPGLEAVFSVNAGVEALLESNEVPSAVPIVRLADDGLADGMLEWVLAEVLAWHRNLFAYRRLQDERRWAPMAEKLAAARPVTVLGAGHLGAPVARALAGLGFPVRTWSRTAKTIAGVRCLAGRDALAEAVAGAEILVNLLPLTPHTEGLLDEPLLRRLAPGSVLINGGRGRHVVDAAVLALLDEEHMRAAVLDVFREEPLPPSDPLWHHPNVFISPHVAAPTHAASAAAVIAANILRHDAGEALHDVVNRDLGY